MSRLKELIAELCPNGVESKRLGEVIISLTTGLNPRQFFTLNTEDAKNYYVTIREIHNQKIIFSDKTDRINDNALRLCNNRSNLEVGDVLFSGTGTIGETAVITDYPYNWNIKEGVYSIKPQPLKIISKYLMYILNSSSVKADYMKKAAGGTVKSVPMGELRKITLPVPPLPVQEEIVRILDTFSELTAELTAELTVELAKRKQQYQYYRDNLIDFSENRAEKSKKLEELISELCPNGVEYKTLGELCTIYDGTHQTPKYTTSGIKFVSVENIDDLYGSKKYISIEDYEKNYKIKPQKNDIFMTRIGTIGACTVVNSSEPLAYYVTLTLIRPNQNEIISKYVKYIIESKHGRKELWRRTLVNASPIKINLGEIGKIKIPVPPLLIQKEIVAILDRFDALCNDLTSGLPAEIEARKKQYEYYRDKLLTFKEAV